jgi:arylsulfatase A-like enzyme
MTGKYPARLKLTNFLVGKRIREDSPILPAPYRHELPLEEVTIADALRGAGYATCHIGKWHLGEESFYPEHQGFDVNIGGCHSGMPRSFFWPKWGGNPPIVGRREGEYLPDRLADEAVQFIEKNKDRPFFLYLAHYAVHIPIEAKKAMIDKYIAKPKPEGGQDNPIYAAMVESIDESVGRVVGTLARLGIDQRTVIIFTSDNGGLSVREGAHTPATCNSPLRGGKGHLYEGGIRVPWIVKWPGAVQAGGVCDVPVISNDFFPTMLEIAGLKNIKTNGQIDGVSIVPLLKQNGVIKRDALFWHYPHFANQGGRPGAIIRHGDFKLIERYEDGTLELYNLREDIGERRNLVLERPRRAQELRKRLDEWRNSVDANMPIRNPNYARGR